MEGARSAIEPAAALVVPRAEKKIEGVGVMALRLLAQEEKSVDIKGWSLGSVEEGARRERE